MKDATAKSSRFSLLYAFVVLLASIVFRIFIPIKYHYPERANLDAPYIVIGNHLSMLDPIIVGYACRKYQVRFLGKDDLTKNPILRFLFSRIHMIPVSRYNTDMKALRESLQVLKQGHVLCIFPEGTRYRDGVMEDMEGGVAMIALQSGVPILPAYIQEKPRLFRTTHCYFGEVFTVSDLKTKGITKDTSQQVLARIREIYRKLVQDGAQTQA